MAVSVPILRLADTGQWHAKALAVQSSSRPVQRGLVPTQQWVIFDNLNLGGFIMKKQIFTVIALLVVLTGTAFAQEQDEPKKVTSVQVLDFPHGYESVLTTVKAAYQPISIMVVRGDNSVATRFVQVQFQGIEQRATGTEYEISEKKSGKSAAFKEALIAGTQVFGNYAYNKGSYYGGQLAYDVSYRLQQKRYEEENRRLNPPSFSTVTVMVKFRNIVYDRNKPNPEELKQNDPRYDGDMTWSKTPKVTPLEVVFKIAAPNFPVAKQYRLITVMLPDGTEGPTFRIESDDWQSVVVPYAVAFKLGGQQ